jgi:ubiquinone/menaquinone biosynthesis C-methylase UbiE
MTLTCPNCKVPLVLKGETFHCKKCGLECTQDRDIYDFLGDSGYYWGEISIEEMEEVLRKSQSRGWRSAVRDIIYKYADMEKYILHNGRVDWLFHCLDLSHTNSCLDVGSGWGTITFALAEFYGEVWSLEAVKQRIKFQRIRKEQDGVENVYLVRSDFGDLPFPNDYFDLVCVNGVLEWLGLSDFSKNPKRIQLDFLREVRRILKPNGCLYVGIENRFGLSSLLGSKDHSGLPFTSILPRKLADFAVRLLRRTNGIYKHERRMSEEWLDYRTYTYSFWGYKRLLKEAGFDQTDLYWTLGYNNPKESGRFDDESFSFLLKFYKDTVVFRRRSRSFLVSVSSHFPGRFVKAILRLVCPDFLIFAYKDGNVSLFESTLTQMESSSSFVRISGSAGVSSKVVYFLLRNGKLHSILKFPRFRENASGLIAEEARMEQFNQLDIKRKVINSTPVFIEKPILGRAPRPSDLSDNLKVLDWLIDFQRKTHKGFWDCDQLQARLTELSEFLSELPINNEVRSKAKQSMDLLGQSFRRTKLPKCSEHGDFYSGNIMIGGDGCVYVTDWECYRETGDSLFDFIFFTIHISTKGGTPESFVDNIYGTGKYSGISKSLLSKFSQAKDLAPEVVLLAIPYVILRYIHRATEGTDKTHLGVRRYLYLLELWSEAWSREDNTVILPV